MIDIVKILLWISIILYVFMVAWYVLGSSPTLDMIVFIFTLIFIFLAFESRKDMKFVKKTVEKMDNNLNKLDRLDNIYNVLKERLK